MIGIQDFQPLIQFLIILLNFNQYNQFGICEFIPWIILSMGLMAIEKICLLLQISSNKIFLISFSTIFLVIWSKLPPVGDNRMPEILSPIQN